MNELKIKINKRQMKQKDLYKRRLLAMYEKDIYFFKDLAIKCDLTESWVSKLFLGTKRSKIKEEKIAIVLGYPREYLFGKNSKEVA